MRPRPGRGARAAEWLTDKTVTRRPSIRVADSLIFAEGQVPPELKQQRTRSSSVASHVLQLLRESVRVLLSEAAVADVVLFIYIFFTFLSPILHV